MTNLQAESKPISPVLLRRLWFYTPIALGTLVAALLAATVLVPQWLVVQADLKRRTQLQAFRDEVLQGRARVKAIVTQEEKARASQEKLFEIVTGNGDLTTFMAMVDREATLSGVQVDLYEPQQPAEPPPGAAPGTAPAAAAQRGLGPSQAPAGAPAGAGQPNPAGALERKIPGLNSRSILVSARGSYPELLAFLRRLELLKVLVVQSDLRLQFEEKAAAASPQDRASQGEPSKPVQLKVLVSLYGRDPAAQARGNPTSGAPPGATPGATPGAPPSSAAPAAPPPIPPPVSSVAPAPAR
jgi:type IV pilus assembly protein PilO